MGHPLQKPSRSSPVLPQEKPRQDGTSSYDVLTGVASD